MVMAIPGWAQPPAILQEGVSNSGSRIPPSLAGGFLAPGGQFTVLGLRFGSTADTMVRVKSRNRTFDALLISVDPKKLIGVLPVDIPPGPASLFVFTQGEPSLPFDIRVAPSAFGIFTETGEGWGAALRSPSGMLRPNQWVKIQGTGLGNVRTPQVLVGGRTAVVRSAGHTNQPGIDEIEFQIPRDVAEGCYVPVMVQVAPQLVSNFATLPVSAAGETCTQLEGWPRSGMRSYGMLLLTRLNLQLQLHGRQMEDTVHDEANAIFVKRAEGDQGLSGMNAVPPPGACTVYTGRFGGGPTSATLLGGAFNTAPGRRINVGPAIQIHTSWGDRSLPLRSEGLYETVMGSDLIAGSPAGGTYLEPGNYLVSAPGGADIGGFSLAFTVPRPVQWTNRNKISRIDRDHGVDIEWRNADPMRPVLILAGNVDQDTTASALTLCVAPPESGRFHIPAAMLANLPVTSGSGGLPLSLLVVAQAAASAQKPIEAKGIENAFAIMIQGAVKSVVYR
jgi:uncharacterized protein (TIGR03437 family)